MFGNVTDLVGWLPGSRRTAGFWVSGFGFRVSGGDSDWKPKAKAVNPNPSTFWPWASRLAANCSLTSLDISANALLKRCERVSCQAAQIQREKTLLKRFERINCEIN